MNTHAIVLNDQFFNQRNRKVKTTPTSQLTSKDAHEISNIYFISCTTCCHDNNKKDHSHRQAREDEKYAQAIQTRPDTELSRLE